MSTPIESVATTAAEAYEKYMVPGMFLHWAEMLVRIAAPQPDENVLDVACGTGIGARLVAEISGGTGRIAGLDMDQGMIEVARKSAGRCAVPIQWHCASALSMPFDVALFDLCLCLPGTTVPARPHRVSRGPAARSQTDGSPRRERPGTARSKRGASRGCSRTGAGAVSMPLRLSARVL